MLKSCFLEDAPMPHLFLLSAFVASFFCYFKKRYRAIAYMFPFFVLWIFAALRYGYGNDYFSYYNAFLNIKAGGQAFREEGLFVLLMKVFPDFYTFIAFASLITIYPVYKLVSRYLEAKYLPVAMFIYCFNPYFFLISLSAIRQFIAISCFVLATYYSYKKKPVLYLVIIVIASLIHSSAIVLVPVYFVANDKKIPSWALFLFAVATAVLLLSGEYFLSLINKVLEIIENEDYSHHFENGATSSLRSVVLSSIFLLYTVLNINKLEGKVLMFAKLYLIGTAIAVLSFHVNMLVRLQYYFDVFSVVVIPTIMRCNSITSPKSVSGLINKYLCPILMFGTLMGRYINFFNDPLWERFVNYRTIFDVLF